MVNPVCCQTTVMRMAQIDHVGSASQTFCMLLEPDQAEEAVEGSVELEDELPHVGDGEGAEHDGHEQQRPQDVARLEHAVDREREEQAEDVREDDRGEREEQRVPHGAEHQGILEDPLEVVEADERPVAEAGPVGEGEEAAGQRRDVVDRDDQDDGRKGPPPVAEADERLLAALPRRRRVPRLGRHGECASAALVDRHCHLLSDLVVTRSAVQWGALRQLWHTCVGKTH